MDLDFWYIFEGLILIVVCSVGYTLFSRYTGFTDIMFNSINEELDKIPHSRKIITVICAIILVFSVMNLWQGWNNPCAIGWPIRGTIPDYCIHKSTEALDSWLK